ncbi:MAG: hypothetical protein J6H31_16005, partial [Butyrivibrio sp.]|nr:hypothetical protein [Butyrivibrio sp.]
NFLGGLSNTMLLKTLVNSNLKRNREPIVERGGRTQKRGAASFSATAPIELVMPSVDNVRL